MATYGFLDRSTGRLVRVSCDPEGSISGVSFSLCREETAPVFQVSSPDLLRDVLDEDMPSYNTSPDRPAWGPFGIADLQPVQIEVAVNISPVKVRPRPKLIVIDSRDIPSRVAGRYLGRADLEPRTHMLCRVDTTLDGQSRDDLEKMVGHSVRVGSYHQRLVVGIGDMPEEFVPDGARPEDYALLIMKPEEAKPFSVESADVAIVLSGMNV